MAQNGPCLRHSGETRSEQIMRAPGAGTTGRLIASPSGKANAQAVGRRTTVSIVKCAPASIAGRAGRIRVRRASVQWAKSVSRGEAIGNAHPRPRRCKRRRHARTESRDQLWGEPARSRPYRVRGCISLPVKAAPRRDRKSEMAIVAADRPDNITGREVRAISSDAPTFGEGPA
jgi:hypothetical protein